MNEVNHRIFTLAKAALSANIGCILTSLYLLNNLGRTCLALPKSARHVMAMPLSIERIHIFDIEEVYAYSLSPADRRAIRRIIFEHFEYIMAEYEAFHAGVS